MLEELVDDIEVLDWYTRDNAKSPELHEVRQQVQIHHYFVRQADYVVDSGRSLHKYTCLLSTCTPCFPYSGPKTRYDPPLL